VTLSEWAAAIGLAVAAIVAVVGELLPREWRRDL
jgi:hypothetical protein